MRQLIGTTRKTRAIAISFFGVAIGLATGNPSFAGILSAKALNVVTMSIALDDSSDRIVNIELQVTFDEGATFATLGLGKPRPLNLFHSIQYGSRQANISVAFAGDLQNTSGEFFPDVPGEYWFRWRLWMNDINTAPLELDQKVKFAPVAISDSLFLDRLGTEKMMRELFGDTYFDRLNEDSRARWMGPKNHDMRALRVIGELLEATREYELGHFSFASVVKTREDAARWADGLWALVQEIPDSTYAPYAAYFVGQCHYTAAMADAITTVRARRIPEKKKDNVNEHFQLVELLEEDKRFSQGKEALQFACEHGDAYLKPLALYHFGAFRIAGGQSEKGEALLREALALTGPEGTLAEKVTKALGELERAKPIIAEYVKKRAETKPG